MSQQPSPSPPTASTPSKFTAGAATDSPVLSQPTTPTAAAISAAAPAPAAVAAAAVARSEDATSVNTINMNSSMHSSLLNGPSVRTGSAPEDSRKRSAHDDASPSPQRPASPPECSSSPSGVALDFGNGQSGAAEGAGHGQAATAAAVSTLGEGDATRKPYPPQEAAGDARRLAEEPIKQIEGPKRPTKRSTGRQHPSASGDVLKDWAHANNSLVVAPPMDMDANLSNADFTLSLIHI